MKRTQWRIVTLLIFALFTLTACGTATNSETGESAEGTSEEEPTKLGLSPWPGWYFWFLVEEKGFFEQNGTQGTLKTDKI